MLMENSPHVRGSPAQLRQEAASAGLQAAQICECWAAGCSGGLECNTSHPACADICRTVLRAGLNLIDTSAAKSTQMSSHRVQNGLCQFVRKYVEYMLLLFGP